MMRWFVWALDENNAIEEMYHCQEYKTVDEAMKKTPQRWFKLYEVTAKEIGE